LATDTRTYIVRGKAPGELTAGSGSSTAGMAMGAPTPGFGSAPACAGATASGAPWASAALSPPPTRETTGAPAPSHEARLGDSRLLLKLRSNQAASAAPRAVGKVPLGTPSRPSPFFLLPLMVYTANSCPSVTLAWPHGWLPQGGYRMTANDQ